MNVMISFWIPPQERARSLARICGGVFIIFMEILKLISVVVNSFIKKLPIYFKI